MKKTLVLAMAALALAACDSPTGSGSRTITGTYVMLPYTGMSFPIDHGSGMFLESDTLKIVNDSVFAYTTVWSMHYADGKVEPRVVNEPGKYTRSGSFLTLTRDSDAVETAVVNGDTLKVTWSGTRVYVRRP